MKLLLFPLQLFLSALLTLLCLVVAIVFAIGYCLTLSSPRPVACLLVDALREIWDRPRDQMGGESRYREWLGLLLVCLFTFAATVGASAAESGRTSPAMSGRAWPASSLPAAVLIGSQTLAETPPSLTQGEGAWLLQGLGVIAFVLGILVLLKKLREPALRVPLGVRAEVDFVEEPRFEQFEEYVHKNNHDFRKQLQHLSLSAEERRTEAAEQSKVLMEKVTEIAEKLDGKRSVSVGNLHEKLRDTDTKLAAVAKEAEVHTQQLVQMDVKLTNILRVMPRSRGGGENS